MSTNPGRPQPRSNNPSSKSILENTDIAQMLSVFNLLEDTIFWIKDSNGQFVFANEYFMEHSGIDGLDELVGSTDYDFVPREIADQFRIDDNLVLEGTDVHDRLEVNILRSGDVAWFLTSKRVIKDRDGLNVGTTGISRHLDNTSIQLKAVDQLRIPIDYIRKHFDEPIDINELASLSHLSVSALERRFKKYIKKSPKQFINQLRLENARRLLRETIKPISVIATESGFSEPGYFCRKYREAFGETPSDFREKYTAPGN